MSFWYKANVLVTGANGFAGSSLCKLLLEQEANVFALVRDDSNVSNLREILSRLHLVYGDVRYPETINRATTGMDYVFNLAAKVNIEETRKNQSDTLRTNINGALNVANACKKYDVKRLVHVSTCHVYGNLDEALLPLKEDAIPQPVDIYSISKYAAELIVRGIGDSGLDVVMTRAFNHYGPGQKGDFFVAKVIRHLLNGEQPRLGGGKSTRDYSFVDDITRGYMLAAEKGKRGKTYHFASSKEISIEQLYGEIAKAVGTDMKPIWQSARHNDMSRSVGNCDLARNELGWNHEIDLGEGLLLTTDWWKKHPELLLQN